MIISDEQARLAALDLKATTHPARSARPRVERELMERVRAAIESAPDTRADRVADAACRLGLGCPDSHEVASKMIGRILSDSVR